MFSWLKKHFIPHEGNDHRPHILRDYSFRAFLVLIIFLEIFSFVLPTLTKINLTDGMAAVLSAVLDDLTNEQRQAQNLQPLTVNPVLNKAAEMKARDMATLGYFAHISPEGKNPWYWLKQVGYKYEYAGENLAINFTDSKDVTSAWMNSPTHKANIVKEKYTEIGTGVASGIYQGRVAIFVAQVYANPLPLSDVAPQVQSEKIAVENTAMPTSVAVEPENVLGVEAVQNNPDVKNVKVEPAKQVRLWEKLLASPRNSVNTALYVIFLTFVLALFFYLFIRMRNHHLDLVTNGLAVLAIVGAIFVTNFYISNTSMIITDSVDYGQQF